MPAAGPPSTPSPADRDEKTISLLLIDLQNVFCLSEFELFVAGRSGRGAVDDNVRLCQFIYRHIGLITQVLVTRHGHSVPDIYGSGASNDAAADGKLVFGAGGPVRKSWRARLESALAPGVVDQLMAAWPYPDVPGGASHALVPAVDEALFFHAVSRKTEIRTVGADDGVRQLAEVLRASDVLIVAGQPKSHCVASTIEALIAGIGTDDRALVSRIYLLADCTLPVVVPGVLDCTECAEASFRRFAEAGAHLVKSTNFVPGP
jgi:nicotinamidase-related amidase